MFTNSLLLIKVIRYVTQGICHVIPAGTQRCINIEIWLNIGHDVVQPYFNVDTTTKLQRRLNVEMTTFNFEASTVFQRRPL